MSDFHPRVFPRLRLRLAAWLGLRGLLLLAATVASLALALGLLDAAADLPEATRAGAPWMLASGAGLVTLALILHWLRCTELRLARRFEQIAPGLGNRLSNAVQLGARPADTGVGEFLRREAVALGRQAAAGLSTWTLVRRGIGWTAAFAGAVAVAWFVSLWASPEIAQAIWPRFLDPHGDHPPYSPVKIAVHPAGGDVLYGGQIEIRATVAGRPVDKLWLVSRAGTNTSRAIMFLAPDKSFFQTLSHLRQPAKYFVTDGRARSRLYPIEIRYTPQITLAEVSIQYPDYTSKASRTTRLAEEPMALPEGSRISFRLASNRPLQAGTLTLTPVLGGKATEVVLPTDATQSNIVAGAFTLDAAVAYSVSVRDIDGLACAEPRRGRFNLLPDERPRLLVLEPGRNAVATPTIRLPIKVEAQDDYGVTRVVWLRGHNRSIERPLNLPLTLKNGAQSVEAAGALELARLGVRPGDVIDYYFEAADNYPKGPNIALSRLYRLEIISEERYQEILRQTAARKALFEPYLKTSAWLSRLAEQARDLADKARDSDPAARESARALAEQLDQYLDELAQLMRQPQMFDVEQSFRTTLVEQHSRATAARDQLKQSLAGGQLDSNQLKSAAEALSRLAETAQDQIAQPARQIASVAQLVARADSFVRLAKQQETLAQMLRRFSLRTDALSRLEQMEVQELAHAQARVRDGLKTLAAQLPELLAQVPEEAEYATLRQDVTQFLQALAEARIENDLADAAKALLEPDTMTGHALAQQAAVKMDKLIARCNALPGQGQQCLTARFTPKLTQPGVGDSLQQILAAMNSGQGNGQGGEDGYGLFNEDVALYGPNVQLAGEQAGGRTDRDRDQRGGRGGPAARLGGATQDPALPTPEGPGRVRLQPNAKFPLRYRDLVGEYFRAIAETEAGGAR